MKKNILSKLITLFVLISIICCCEDCSVDPPVVDPPIIPEDIPRDETPAWSPDGNWIAYTHYNPDVSDTTYPNGLYIVDTTGQNRRLLIAGPAYNPDWSPDGNKIAFNNGDIFIINFTGDSIIAITNVGSSFLPRWAPNGLKISFARSGVQDTVGIWITDLNDGSMTRWDYGSAPADWSPDGLKFVYGNSPISSTTESQIWIADVNGNNKLQLSSNSYITNRYPSWSPDGLKIAWSATHNGNSDILSMDADGSNQHKLTKGIYPTFSPNSQKIIFQNFNESNDKMVLWMINIDGSRLKQITW